MIDVVSHEILDHSVTLKNVSDSSEHCQLISSALIEAELVWVYGDGAYDSKRNYEHAKENEYKLVCRCQKNAVTHSRGCPQRAQVVHEIKSKGLKSRKRRVKYGNRWSVERSYSTFKRIFGDRLQARLWERILDGIRFKVQVYNYFIWIY
ncbi:MAG: transposase [Promethearchaeota archaeon]